MSSKFILFFLCLTYLLNSCSEEKKADNKITLSIPLEIRVPPDIRPYNLAAQQFRHNPSKPTIISIVGASCNDCIPELKSWHSYIQNQKLSPEWNYYFIALGNPNFYFQDNLLRQKRYASLPIYIDPDSSILKVNNINRSYWRKFKTLTLDKNDSLLHVGSPHDDEENLRIINNVIK